MKILEAFLGLIQGCPHEDQPETLTEDIKKLRAKFRQVIFFLPDEYHTNLYKSLNPKYTDQTDLAQNALQPELFFSFFF